MQLNTGMFQRQELKQILAPRMIQSMEILQLPIMALQERIEHELQENPVLEQRETKADEKDGAGEDESFDGAEAKEDVEAPERELVIDDKNDFEKDFDRLEAMNREWSDHFNEEGRPSVNRISEESDKKHD